MLDWNRQCENHWRKNHKTSESFASGGVKFIRKSENVSGFAIGRALSVSQSEGEKNSRKFILDSGCTSHILTTKENFTEFFEPEEELFISNVDLSRHKVIA